MTADLLALALAVMPALAAVLIRARLGHLLGRLPRAVLQRLGMSEGTSGTVVELVAAPHAAAWKRRRDRIIDRFLIYGLPRWISLPGEWARPMAQWRLRVLILLAVSAAGPFLAAQKAWALLPFVLVIGLGALRAKTVGPWPAT